MKSLVEKTEEEIQAELQKLLANLESGVTKHLQRNIPQPPPPE